MKLRMMDPADIMIIVSSLIIFSIGVYAFFVTLSNIPIVAPGHTTAMQNSTYYAIRNASATGNNVFNVVGVVLIVGAIMTIIGIIYSYIRPRGY